MCESMYDYRYDRYEDTFKPIVIDKCDICQQDIHERETYYDILGTIICVECIKDFKMKG